MENATTLPILLALATFGICLFLALLSKRRTDNKIDDNTARKSSLAVDGNPHRAAK